MPGPFTAAALAAAGGWSLRTFECSTVKVLQSVHTVACETHWGSGLAFAQWVGTHLVCCGFPGTKCTQCARLNCGGRRLPAELLRAASRDLRLSCLLPWGNTAVSCSIVYNAACQACCELHLTPVQMRCWHGAALLTHLYRWDLLKVAVVILLDAVLAWCCAHE